MFDFGFGVRGLIPSTQLAFQSDGHSGTIRKDEKAGLQTYKTNLAQSVGDEMKAVSVVKPTPNDVSICIIQFFASDHDYVKRDVDNMAKTILDALSGTVYLDDAQVRLLLVSKRCDHRVKDNFSYIAINELKKDSTPALLRDAGYEKAVTLFNKSKNT